MIKVEKGFVEIDGDAIEVCADMSVIFTSVAQAFSEAYGNKATETLLKAVIARHQENAKAMGFNLTPTEREKQVFTEASMAVDEKFGTSKGNPFTMGMFGSPLDDFLMGFGTKGE